MTWVIAACALAAVVVRPFRINEAVWAGAGALVLVLTGSVRVADAVAALLRGLDVYGFLIGMMALAEFAQIEGVFAWLAARAVRLALGSRVGLFLLVYAVGVLTTALLSNDATIVVLTPAVIAAVRTLDADPLPYLYACALVANAASFVLPISNPSNLLVFAGHMPALATWLHVLLAPSAAAIVATAAALALTFRRELRGSAVAAAGPPAAAPRPLAIAALALAAVVLIGVSSVGGPLGAATLGVAAAAFAVAGTGDRAAPGRIVRGISWPIVPLTAALFVIVAAVDGAGASTATRQLFEHVQPLEIGWATALASNLVNNLPVGLSVGETIGTLHPAAAASYAALIGVNLGPNFSTNGSLATILWLTILRRSGIAASPLAFLRVGIIVTPVALLAALLLLR